MKVDFDGPCLVYPMNLKPSEMTGAQLREWIVLNSRCEIFRQGKNLSQPDYLQIEFHGPAALIPSAKNTRVTLRSGKSVPNSQVLAHFQAMDRLFMRAVGRQPILYENTELFCVVVIGKRPATFDADNGLAAVKDWLEPHKVKGGKTVRRWGAGIVADDRFVTGFALHSRKVVEVQHTTIIIRPWKAAQEHVATMLARVIAG